MLPLLCYIDRCFRSFFVRQIRHTYQQSFYRLSDNVFFSPLLRWMDQCYKMASRHTELMSNNKSLLHF